MIQRECQVAECLESDVEQTRSPEGTKSLEDVIFKVSKPTAQAGFIGAIARVGDKTGGRIAIGSQEFSQGWEIAL